MSCNRTGCVTRQITGGQGIEFLKCPEDCSGPSDRPEIKEYVCVCPLRDNGNGADRVLLGERHAEPYRGYLNLLGGKVEKGETSEEAAARELTEESQLIGRNFKCRGLVTVPNKAQVWFFTCRLTNLYSIPCDPVPGVRWYRCPDVYEQKQWPIVPNLKIIIPLLMSGAPEWHVVETSPNELVIKGWKP